MGGSSASEVEVHFARSAQELGKIPDGTGSPHTSRVNAALRGSRFLQALSNSERNIVLEHADSRSYSIKSIVAEQGTIADRLFLLVTGSARHFFITSEGRKVNLFWLLPGDIFGGASLLREPAEFIVSTEITRHTQLLVWKRDALRRLVLQIPRLLENGVSISCDYLVWYLATHLSLISNSARERLAHVLVSLSRGIGQKSSKGITLEITNEQLANTANISPFTVSRLLAEWQRNGVLLKSRGRLQLCRSDQLFNKTP